MRRRIFPFLAVAVFSGCKKNQINPPIGNSEIIRSKENEDKQFIDYLAVYLQTIGWGFDSDQLVTKTTKKLENAIQIIESDNPMKNIYSSTHEELNLLKTRIPSLIPGITREINAARESKRFGGQSLAHFSNLLGISQLVIQAKDRPELAPYLELDVGPLLLRFQDGPNKLGNVGQPTEVLTRLRAVRSQCLKVKSDKECTLDLLDIATASAIISSRGFKEGQIMKVIEGCALLPVLTTGDYKRLIEGSKLFLEIPLETSLDQRDLQAKEILCPHFN
jgi:hypothetical protein